MQAFPNNQLSTETSSADTQQQTRVKTSQRSRVVGGKNKASGLRSRPRWQNPNDKTQSEHRRITIAAIMMIMHERKGSNASAEWRQKVPHMARRFELELYRSAASLREYVDDTTLRRRMWTIAIRARKQLGTPGWNRRVVLDKQLLLDGQENATRVAAP